MDASSDIYKKKNNIAIERESDLPKLQNLNQTLNPKP